MCVCVFVFSCKFGNYIPHHFPASIQIVTASLKSVCKNLFPFKTVTKCVTLVKEAFKEEAVGNSQAWLIKWDDS